MNYLLTVKTLLLTLCVLMAAMTVCKSQRLSFGVRVGLNLSNEINTSPGFFSPGTPIATGQIWKTGFVIGGYAKWMITKKVGIQPELLYSVLGSRQGQTLFYPHYGGPFTPAWVVLTPASTFSSNYLSLPVLFRFNFTNYFHIEAGPQISYLLAVNFKPIDSYPPENRNNYNAFDFGSVIGVGSDPGRFNISIRYYQGFSNEANNIKPFSGTLKNEAFQLVAGYRLWNKKRA
jgi:hypothetical protein